MAYRKRRGRPNGRFRKATRIVMHQKARPSKYLPWVGHKPTITTIRAPSAIGDSTFVKLKYVTGQNLTAAGNVDRVYRGNGAFDPDQSGAGMQPYGWDEWAAFYTKYICYGSSIKVMGKSTVNLLTVLGVVPKLNTTSEGFTELVGEPYGKFTMINSNAAGNTTKIKHFMTTRKMFGLDKNQVGNADYTGTVATGTPASEFYWHVIVDDATGSTGTTNVTVLVEITYYIKFFERTDLDRS